jgi:hypothetical protein
MQSIAMSGCIAKMAMAGTLQKRKICAGMSQN